MTKRTAQKNTTYVIVLTLIALVLSILSTLLVISMHSMLRADRQAAAESRLSQWHDLVRLRTCYEHGINPCDDTGITEWNTSNPDQAFTLTRPSL